MTNIIRLPNQGIVVNLKLLTAISKDGDYDIYLDCGDSRPIIAHYKSPSERNSAYLQIYNSFMNCISGDGTSSKPRLSIVEEPSND